MLTVLRELFSPPRRWVTKPQFLRQSEGAVAVEYAVMLALLAAGMLVSIQAVGSQTNSLLRFVSGSLFSSGNQTGEGASMNPTARPPGSLPMRAPTSIAETAN